MLLSGFDKKKNGYLTIGVAAGLFVLTIAGLSIASYTRSRKRMAAKKATGSNSI